MKSQESSYDYLLSVSGSVNMYSAAEPVALWIARHMGAPSEDVVVIFQTSDESLRLAGWLADWHTIIDLYYVSL